MECPICSRKNGVEIDMHADGYARNILECSSCGSMWITRNGDVTLLNNKVA